LCLPAIPAHPPAAFAGGGWLPLVAIVQCFIQGITSTRLLLDPHVNLIRKRCLLLNRQGADFCTQLRQAAIDFVDLVLGGPWR
jgi:hypothetical protein